ncbi:MAG: hypothetical protein Kow0062_22990 [Acidobacteriota bacterium]|nr:MAG: flagellar basal body rod protein FlgB [Acidobacteriota bacterium]
MTIQRPAMPFIERLGRSLDVMSRRQQLIASNVGNAETPRYRTVDIDFNDALARALAPRPSDRGGRQAAGTAVHRAVAVRPREVDGLPARPDGNNVNIEREMAALAETRSRYRVAAMLVRTRFRQIAAALTGGRNG